MNGRCRQTIGKFRNAEGKIAPKKFLLGTDERADQLASLRLGQLSDDVVKIVESESRERSAMHEKWLADAVSSSVQPAIWTEEALRIADEIRLGRPLSVFRTTGAGQTGRTWRWSTDRDVATRA